MRRSGEFRNAAFMRQRRILSAPLSDDFFNYFSTYVREPKVAAGVAIGKLFVVETEEAQHGRVQIVDMNRVFHGSETEFVRRSVNVTAFDTAGGEPDGEAIMVVVPALN